MITNCKNGVSSYEIHRDIHVTQKSAWFMLHRIRLAMQGDVVDTFGGEVEVDETYIGGLARNMHKDVRARKIQGRTGWVGKTAVFGLLERNKEGNRAKCMLAFFLNRGRMKREKSSANSSHPDLQSIPTSMAPIIRWVLRDS